MDGDGKITTEELRLTMIKLMGDHMTPREIDSIVKEADDNGDGTVDFEGKNSVGNTDLRQLIRHVGALSTHRTLLSSMQSSWE